MGVKVAFLEENKPAAKGKEKDKGPQAVALIPKSAVRSDSSASFVYLLRDGKVERRAVSLGIDRGTEVAVLAGVTPGDSVRSEEHTSELQSRGHLVCRLLLEKK